MSQQNGGFGRRGMQPAPEASRPVSVSSGGGIPRLVKQIGGMALGFALVFAVGYVSDYSMKQAGKSLDRSFVERANPGNPAAAIEQAGDDVLLKRVHRVCTDRAATAELTDAQKRATFTDSLYIVEYRLARAGAYVACLTKEQPQRFCQAPQRQHLFEAVRQYFKLVVQAREEWQLQIGSPAAAITEKPIDFNQRAASGMPSSRMDPQFVEGLVALDTNGYIPASDFARLVPNGLPGTLGGNAHGMPPLPAVGPTNAQTRKTACG